VLLVTPAIRVSTAEVFAAFAAGAGGRDPGSTRATSGHIADEWRNGLDATRLFQRAAVLAPANDLLVATSVVAPEVLAARRALVRLLGRPVGQSGSGPTCWVLYPSLAEATAAAATVQDALATGTLSLPGDGPAFVHATTIADPRDPNATSVSPELAGAPVPPGGIISIGGADRRA
jgi:4-diphosphocytidyl-2C-methyl-D-erythritol kinase